MGQQQLLLLVLGIVLVGLAVVVGIEAFSVNQRKAAIDRDVARAAQLAGLATAWRMTPQAFGGGLDAPDSKGLSPAAFGLSDARIVTETAEYLIAETSPGMALAIWYRRTASGPTVEVWNTAYGLKTTLFLYGVDSECVRFRSAQWVGDGEPTEWNDFAFGGGSWDYTPDAEPAVPAGCAW